MNNTLPHWRRGLLTVAVSLGFSALAVHAATGPTSDNLLQNPTFADADKDGEADSWKPYPPGDGSTRILAPIAGGGLTFKDADKGNGLGIEQWIQVQEGLRYTASVNATGEGSASLTLIFSSVKPVRPGDLKSVQLAEKTSRIGVGKTTETTGIAPAGAKWLKVWIYCPKIGVADLAIQKISLTSTTPDASEIPATAPAKTDSSTPASAGSKTTAASTPLAPAAPVGPAPKGNLLKNDTFTFSDPTGLPENWAGYPPGDGASRILAPAPGGGLIFKDDDKNNGLGIEQWVPAQEGLRYTATADIIGNGGVSLGVIFVKEKPRKVSDLKSVQISEKINRAEAGKITETTAIAPAGTKYLKVWIYCPKIGVTDVVVRRTSLVAVAPADATTTGSNPSAVATGPSATAANSGATSAPQKLPAGLDALIDFETGDFSQAHGTEGGTNTIITANEGPVRDGKFAFKSNLKLDKHRAEVAGYRAAAGGVARYGWSIYIPKEFDAKTHFSIVTQWHSYGTGRESPKDGGPPTCITISKGEMQLKLLHQGDEGWTSKATYFPLGSIEDMRGQWTDWVFEVNWQGPGKGGWLKLYKNDKLVLEHTGTTWFEGKESGPYFKFGNYKGSLQWKGTEEGAVLYFDSARMALGEKSTYKLVAPSTYSPRPEAK